MNAVVTGWCGTEFASIAAITLPLIDRYASRHGLSMCAENMRCERPPSWAKVEILLAVLQHAERAVWIDADVVIADGSVSILDEVPIDSWQGIVEHATECGTVPNCGVWVVTRAMVPVLEHVWRATHYLNHPWWEQAALMEQMGYAIAPGLVARLDVPTRLYGRTTFLHPTWNDHPKDTRRVDSPRFVHVTQYPDRIAAAKYYADASR